MIANRAEAWLRRPERKTRLMQITLLVAVLLHAVWFASMLFAPRLYGILTGHRPQIAGPRYATIEMIEQNTKTAGGDHILKDKESSPGRPGSKAKATPATKPSRPVPVTTDGSQKPSQASPQTQATPASQSPDSSGGNPGTGLVSGMSVIPASPDDKHPNLPPAYPELAGVLNQQGTVRMLIHIGADGRATSVDIAQSSGVLELDNSARKAAMGWHFRPVVVGGRAVPSEMPFAMQFTTEGDAPGQ